MFVVLLGAPGAGKGTQAPILAAATGGVHLSTGEMLREAVKLGTPFGVRARDYMSTGSLAPDDIVLGMVMERLSHPDARHAFVMDGFPRNVKQALQLDEALASTQQHLDRAIYVKVPDEILLKR